MAMIGLTLHRSIARLPDAEASVNEPEAVRLAVEALYHRRRDHPHPAPGRRERPVLRAVGSTPGQTVATLVISQSVTVAISCAAGIPLGLLLFGLVEGGDLPSVRLPAALPALVAVAAALFSQLIALPAQLYATRPPAPLLTYD